MSKGKTSRRKQQTTINNKTMTTRREILINEFMSLFDKLTDKERSELYVIANSVDNFGRDYRKNEPSFFDNLPSDVSKYDVARGVCFGNYSYEDDFVYYDALDRVFYSVDTISITEYEKKAIAEFFSNTDEYNYVLDGMWDFSTFYKAKDFKPALYIRVRFIYGIERHTINIPIEEVFHSNSGKCWEYFDYLKSGKLARFVGSYERQTDIKMSVYNASIEDYSDDNLESEDMEVLVTGMFWM